MQAKERGAIGRDGESYDQWLAWDHGLRVRRDRPIDGGPNEGVVAGDLDWGDQSLIDASMAIVGPRASELVAHFYECLFAEQPGLRSLFPDSLVQQREKLRSALLWLVQEPVDPTELLQRLEQLGRDHRKYGARPAHYAVVGKALVSALSDFAGDAWNPAIEQAWAARYAVAANAMMAGAEADPQPPFWFATVVGHQRCADDLAIIRLEPHFPYSYRPGQCATLASDRVRRIWRPFTMATAPARHGELEFHVRATGHGGLSDLLVTDTALGDTVRVGATQGHAALRPASGRIQVFVSSGLGWAPTKAFLEELAQRVPRAAQTVLIQVGADGGTYDPRGSEVRDRCPGLSTVVVDRPEGVRRCLAEIDPAHLEVYVSGGSAFTTVVSDGLAGCGVGAEHTIVSTWPDA